MPLFQQSVLTTYKAGINKENPQPHYNLTTEHKNERDSKKADGAILYNGAVRAVIELKGTDTTDLSRITSQAINYKHNQISTS